MISSLQFRKYFLGTDCYVLLASLIFGVIWTYIAGKDLNFDLLNYHYYLPFSLFNDRLNHDFFPASTQSYLNPIAYIPLYFLNKMGLHSLLTMETLALLHSLNIFILYKICVIFSPQRKSQTVAILLATILGTLNHPYLLELGNSFADIITTIPVMISVLLLCRIEQDNFIKICLISGVLFGIATGLKPTNVITAIPGIIFIFSSLQNKRKKAIFLYICAGLVGLILSSGYWSFLLYKNFDNPVFPLYNAYFKSTLFPAENLAGIRFIPKGILDTIIFPFTMLLIQPWVYLEVIAVDIRPACLAVLLIGLFVAAVLRKFSKFSRPDKLTSKKICFIIYFICIFYLWVITSANGRYGIPQLLLLGPILLIVCGSLFPNKALRSFLLIILIIQVSVLFNSPPHRWNPSIWSASLFEVNVPTKLIDEDFLFFSTTGPSHSYLASLVNKNSSFMNVRGQFIITPEGPGSQRVSELLEKYSGRVRSLTAKVYSKSVSAQTLDNWLELQKGYFARFGLIEDQDDCLTFKLLINSKNADTFVSCALIQKEGLKDEFNESVKNIDQIFNRIVQICPKLFSPQYTVTEHYNNYWKRYYINSEVNLVTEDNQIFVDQFYTLERVYLGTVDDWSSESKHPDISNLCNLDFDRTKSIKKFIKGKG